MRVTEEYQQVRITNLLSRIESNTFWFGLIITGYLILISKDIYELKKRHGTV